MTTQQKLTLLEMANSKHIHDHVLCLELLELNIDHFKNEEVQCLGLLCSRIMFVAGLHHDFNLLFDRWSSAINSKWEQRCNVNYYSGYEKYYELCKKLILKEIIL